MRECCYSECNLQALHSKSHLPMEQRKSSVAMVVEAWTPWMVSRWRRSKVSPLLEDRTSSLFWGWWDHSLSSFSIYEIGYSEAKALFLLTVLKLTVILPSPTKKEWAHGSKPEQAKGRSFQWDHYWRENVWKAFLPHSCDLSSQICYGSLWGLWTS